MNITFLFSLDSRSIDKNNSSKDNQTIVVILMVSIGILTCFICSIHEYCRRRNILSLQIQQESPIINRYYPQLLLEPSAPPILNETIHSWGNIRNPLLPDYNTAIVIVQSTVITSADEPPAYRGKKFIFIIILLLFFFDCRSFS